jgi:hypothetical protein
VYRVTKFFKKKVALVVRDLCTTKDLKTVLGLGEGKSCMILFMSSVGYAT